MLDRTGKILFALIAAGLWANLAAPVLQPARAEADNGTYLILILNTVSDIARGKCSNPKIC
jgi:hypothetical protein